MTDLVVHTIPIKKSKCTYYDFKLPFWAKTTTDYDFFRNYLRKLPLAVRKTAHFMIQADEKAWHEAEVNIPSIYMDLLAYSLKFSDH